MKNNFKKILDYLSHLYNGIILPFYMKFTVDDYNSSSNEDFWIILYIIYIRIIAHSWINFDNPHVIFILYMIWLWCMCTVFYCFLRCYRQLQCAFCVSNITYYYNSFFTQLLQSVCLKMYPLYCTWYRYLLINKTSFFVLSTNS
jgi:hypothetical protein